MRRGSLSRSLLLPLTAFLLLGAAAPLAAAPLAEKLAGTWTCQAREGDTSLAMTLRYRLSNGWLIGEVTEDNGATLLDVWLDDGLANRLALRRVLSSDATVEMQVVEEIAEQVKLAGEMRHVLGTGGPVREELRFTGSDTFTATWEAENGDGWQRVLARNCKRTD